MTNRTLYLKKIKLSGAGKKEARKSALERAHKIREFEIELYWKRANYFWILQAAVFAAAGLTWKTDSNLPSLLPLALCALGAIVSWAGWLGARASKFWQRNWEHHIDMLETEFEGRLYKTVYISPSGINWSITGVSEQLLLCFFMFWTACLICFPFVLNSNWSLSPSDIAPSLRISDVLTVIIWILAAFGIFALYRQVSGVKGTIIGYAGDWQDGVSFPGRPRLTRTSNKKAFLVQREPTIP